MQDRITMNSKSLQAKFPEVYREFFSKCPIVVSAPGNFFWTGEYTHRFGGLSIKQHLPLRAYVGLEPHSSSSINLGDSFYFDLLDQHIKSRAFPSTIQNKLIEYLNHLYGHIETNKKAGFKIHTVLEIPQHDGLAYSNAWSASLAVAVQLYLNSSSIGKVIGWRRIPLSRLSDDKEFNKTFSAVRKIESLFWWGTTSGVSSFTAMASSDLPIIYFIEEDQKNPIDSESIYQRKYYAFRLDELGNKPSRIDEVTEWPIDFGLIYSGVSVWTEGAIKSLQSLEWYLNDISKEWKKIFKTYNIPNKNILLSKLINYPKFRKTDPYINALSYISLEVLYGLLWAFSEGFNEEALNFLFRAINRNHKLLGSINTSSPVLDKICLLVDQEARKSGDSLGAGCKLNGAGKGGDILFITKRHGFDDKINDLIAGLRKEIKGDVCLDYASWIDGFEKEGVRVEQHIAEGIYSKFISEGAISLKNFTKEGALQTELTSLENFEKEKGEIDLLLNAMENDIYVRGEKLTSKEIPSSSATVEILSILLDNLGKSISNFQLPESSYSKDRNEMQSKIISPLVKIIKLKTKKSLPLKISGGLAEFRIKLDPSDLDIRILNKVF